MGFLQASRNSIPVRLATVLPGQAPIYRSKRYGVVHTYLEEKRGGPNLLIKHILTLENESILPRSFYLWL